MASVSDRLDAEAGRRVLEVARDVDRLGPAGRRRDEAHARRALDLVLHEAPAHASARARRERARRRPARGATRRRPRRRSAAALAAGAAARGARRGARRRAAPWPRRLRRRRCRRPPAAASSVLAGRPSPARARALRGAALAGGRRRAVVGGRRFVRHGVPVRRGGAAGSSAGALGRGARARRRACSAARGVLGVRLTARARPRAPGRARAPRQQRAARPERRGPPRSGRAGAGATSDAASPEQRGELAGAPQHEQSREADEQHAQAAEHAPEPVRQLAARRARRRREAHADDRVAARADARELGGVRPEHGAARLGARLRGERLHVVQISSARRLGQTSSDAAPSSRRI